MAQSTKIAAAVAGGYVLGRRRKAKLAIVLTSVLVGRQLKIGSRVRELTGKVLSSVDINQIRHDLLGELRSQAQAAKDAVVSRQVEKLADRLHERTVALSQGTGAREETKEETGGKAGEEESSEADVGSEESSEASEGRSPRRRGRTRIPGQRRDSAARRAASSGKSGSGDK
ncbi:MAG TPA: hypothetical protein VIL34_04130 [Actinopolymorphaceae bacterium]